MCNVYDYSDAAATEIAELEASLEMVLLNIKHQAELNGGRLPTTLTAMRQFVKRCMNHQETKSLAAEIYALF